MPRSTDQTIEITAIRLHAGNGHEHITAVRWRSPTTSVGLATRPRIVDWLGQRSENQAVLADGTAQIQVAVQRPSNQPPWLRARGDGRWTDHLLSLPRL
jgi:hypothetical protein